MLLVDDILLAPARGLFWILREIQNAAEEEVTNEAEAITAQLSQLYMMLETGQISEAEFDSRERKLLDRLEEIQEADPDPEVVYEPAEKGAGDEVLAND